MAENKTRFMRRVNDVPDHLIFAGTFLVGFFILLLFRLVGDSPIIAAVVLVGLLLAYAWIIAGTRRFELRGDRAADNLYYLGFLFTVAALGISLYRFADGSDDVSQNRVELIIRDLGVALTTTLFGLFLRIYFTNQRTDPEEIEARTQQELIDVARNTRTSLTETQRAVEAVAIYSAQVMEESKEALDLARKSVVQSVEELSERVKEIDIPQDLVTSKLDPMIDQAKESINAFARSIEAIQLPQDIIERRIERSFEAVDQQVSARISTLGQSFEAKLNSIEVSPDVVNQQLVQAFEGIRTTTGDIADALQSIPANVQAIDEQVATRISELGQSLEEKLNAIEVSPNVINQQIAQAFEGIRSSTGEIVDSLQSIPESIEAVRVSFSEAESVGKSLALSQETLRSNLAALNEILASSSAELSEASSEMSDFHIAVESSRTNLVRTNEALIQSIDSLRATPETLVSIRESIERIASGVDDSIEKLQMANDSASQGIQSLARDTDEIASIFAKAMRELTETATKQT